MQTALFGNALHVPCAVISTTSNRGTSIRCRSASRDFTPLEKADLQRDVHDRGLNINGDNNKRLIGLQAADNAAVAEPAMMNEPNIQATTGDNLQQNGTQHAPSDAHAPNVPIREAYKTSLRLPNRKKMWEAGAAASTITARLNSKRLTIAGMEDAWAAAALVTARLNSKRRTIAGMEDAWAAATLVTARLNSKRRTIAGMEDAWAAAALVTARLNSKRRTIAGMEDAWAAAALITARLNSERRTIAGMEDAWAAAATVSVARRLAYNVFQGREEAVEAAIFVTAGINALWAQEREVNTGASEEESGVSSNGTVPNISSNQDSRRKLSSGDATIAKRSPNEAQSALEFAAALVKALAAGVQALFKAVAQQDK